MCLKCTYWNIKIYHEKGVPCVSYAKGCVEPKQRQELTEKINSNHSILVNIKPTSNIEVSVCPSNLLFAIHELRQGPADK